MNTTPPPMPEPQWSTMVVNGYQGHYYTAEQIKARDAQWMERITALEAEIAALKPDADELRFLNGDLLYWVDRAVGKGNANSDIEEALTRYEEWCAARTALENTK